MTFGNTGEVVNDSTGIFDVTNDYIEFKKAGTYRITTRIDIEDAGGSATSGFMFIGDQTNVVRTSILTTDASWWGNYSFDFIETYAIGDRLDFRATHSTGENHDLRNMDIIVTEAPASEVVLAGMIQATELDYIIATLSSNTTTPLLSGEYVVPFDTTYASSSGALTLNADGTVDLLAGYRYKMSYGIRFGAATITKMYNFTDGVSISPHFNSTESNNTGGDNPTIYEPATNVTVGLTIDTAQTAYGATGSKGNMQIEVMSTSSITKVDPTLVTPEALAYGRMRYAVDPGNEQITTMQPTDYDTTDYTSLITADPASGTFTALQAGRYEVSYMMGVGALDAGSLNAVAVIDGGAIDMANTIAAATITASTGTNMNVSGTLELDLAIGQSVEVHLVDSTGGTLSSDTISVGSNSRTFSIRQLTGYTVTTPGTVVVDDQAASGYFDIGTMRMQFGEEAAGTAGVVSVTLPIAMGNANYNIQFQTTGTNTAGTFAFTDPIRTTTGFTINKRFNNSATVVDAGEGFMWSVKGLH